MTRPLSWGRAGRGVALAVVLVVAIVPFLYVISAALKSRQSLFEYPPQWIPVHPTLHNIKATFDAGWLTWAGNTLLVSSVVAIVKLGLDATSAYAFAKLDFPGRRAIFGLMAVTVMVPPVALLIPLYFLVRDLGLLNTYWALILPPLANPIGMLMLRGFIQRLPSELEQAARMDGASPWATFTHVIVPLIRPGLVVVGLYQFLLQYTNFVYPLVLAPDKQFITTGLAGLIPAVTPAWGVISAASLLSMVPITVIFLLFQRQFFSVSVGAALKG
jgi:multiple sugar transport system permease protein